MGTEGFWFDLSGECRAPKLPWQRGYAGCFLAR
jgi:hypothetical protein